MSTILLNEIRLVRFELTMPQMRDGLKVRFVRPLREQPMIVFT